MKTISARGSVVLQIVAVLLLVVLAVVIFYPRYERWMLKKKFDATLVAGDTLYRAAQEYYIEKNIWPVAISDLNTKLEAKTKSDWLIANDDYYCEMTYGRGDRLVNDIQCSPRGKYINALTYQIVLGNKNPTRYFCWALKTNKAAKERCLELGGKNPQTVAGQTTPFLVYTLDR